MVQIHLKENREYNSIGRVYALQVYCYRFKSDYFQYYKIPQFDFLSLGSQIFGLFCGLGLYYFFTVYKVLPLYVEVKKFRKKKLMSSTHKIKEISIMCKENSNSVQTFFKKFLIN